MIWTKNGGRTGGLVDALSGDLNYGLFHGLLAAIDATRLTHGGKREVCVLEFGRFLFLYLFRFA